MDIPPMISAMRLPKGEQEAARHISDKLFELSTYSRQFESALQLFDFCEAESSPIDQQISALLRSGNSFIPEYKALRALSNRYIEWRWIAARDATFTVYHFRRVIEAIRGNLKGSKTLQNLADHDRIAEAENRFNAEFPYSKSARDAVGHSADNAASADKILKHSISGTTIPGIIGGSGTFSNLTLNMLSGRTLKMTIGKEIVSAELSERKLIILDDIRRKIWAAYEPVAAHTLNLPIPNSEQQ